MSESLRNDGRVWVPKSKAVAEEIRAGQTDPNSVAEADRDYYLERKYPSFGNLAPGTFLPVPLKRFVMKVAGWPVLVSVSI